MIFFKVDENQNVVYQYRGHEEYMRLTGKTLEELEQEGLLVESIPEPESREGKQSVLKHNGTEFYYEYVDILLTREEYLERELDRVKKHSENTSSDLQAFMDFYFKNGGI